MHTLLHIRAVLASGFALVFNNSKVCLRLCHINIIISLWLLKIDMAYIIERISLIIMSTNLRVCRVTYIHHFPGCRVMFEEGVRELHRHTLPVVWALVLRDAEENGCSIGGWGRDNYYNQIFWLLKWCDHYLHIIIATIFSGLQVQQNANMM